MTTHRTTILRESLAAFVQRYLIHLLGGLIFVGNLYLGSQLQPLIAQQRETASAVVNLEQRLVKVETNQDKYLTRDDLKLFLATIQTEIDIINKQVDVINAKLDRLLTR